MPCALALLLYPNPLVWPAAVVGALPSLTRLVARGRPWARSAFDLPLGLLVGGALLGAWAGLSHDGVAVRLAGLLAGLIVYAAILEHGSTPHRLRSITLGLLAAVAVGTAVSVLIVAPFLRLDRLPPLDWLVGALDPSSLLGRLSDEDWLLQRYRFRASGVGAAADIGMAVAFAAFLGVRGRGGRLALLALAVFFGAALLVADNRGSLLAGALTLGALAGLRQPRSLLLAPLALLVTLGLIAAGLVERGLNLRTIAQRYWFWENSLYLLGELPLTGAGLGTQSVQLTYQAYFLPSNPYFSHAHSIYVQAVLETGLIGLFGLAGLLVATLWVGWRVQRDMTARGVAVDRWVRAASLAGFGAALALFSAGLSEIVALSTVGGTLLLAAAGLLAAAARVARGIVLPDPSKLAEPRAVRGPRFPLTAATSRRTRLLAGAGSLVGLLTLLLATGLAIRLTTVLLLNAGTVELNQATVSEDTTRSARAGHLDRSVGLLRAAASLDATNATVQRNLALALAAQEERRARAAADRARALIPATDARGQFQLGRAYVAMSAWGEAIRAWQTAGAAPQLLQLGNRLVRSRNWEQALAAYTAAVTLNPSSRGAYEGISRVARERHDSVDEAIKEFDPIIALGPPRGGFATAQIARMYREDGRPDRALDVVLGAPPEYRGAELVLEHGIALAELGRWVYAELALEPLVAAPSREPEPYYWLATARAALGKHELAIETARAGLAIVDSNRPSEGAPLFALIGESLLAIERPAEALTAFEDGLAVAQRDDRLRSGADRARALMRG